MALDVDAEGFAFTNPAHFQNFYRVNGDGKSPVIFDSDGSIIDAIFGTGARFEVLGVAGIDTPVGTDTEITGASIIINGAFYDGVGLPASPEDVSLGGLKAAMVHEIGHFINLDHTAVNEELALDDNAGNDVYVPSMFPIAVQDEAALADTNPDDELAAVNLYPPGPPTRTIQGSVSFAGVPFQGANVVIRKGSDPLMSAYSIVSGGLFFPCNAGSACDPCTTACNPGNPPSQGAFSVDFFPPGGDYRVCVEQLDTRFSPMNGTFVGPLATPPIVPGPEECFGAAESGTQADDPDDASTVTAGVGPVANIVLNALPSSDPFEPNNTLGTGATLDDLPTGTDTVPGVLGAGDIDVFNVPVTAGQRVRIDLDAHELGSGLDAVVGFYDNLGALVALSDDAIDPDSHAFTTDPALELTAGFTGVGKLVVSSFPDLDQDGAGGGTTGAYWLRVAVATDTDGDGAVDAEDICPTSARDDPDRDGLCFVADNCPTVTNASQATLTKLNGALTSGGDVSDFWPSPDGARVVYLADKDTNEIFELYSVPVAGGVSTKLNGPLVPGGDVISWDVTPDGSRVVYKADQDDDGVIELYSVPITGGTPVKLNGSFKNGGSLTTFGDFLISPNGAKVLYVADQDTAGVKELYIVPTAGGSSLKLNGALGAGQFIDIGPQFTADGALVLYRRVGLTAIDLFVVPAAGGASTQLNIPGINVNPHLELSQDGTKVIFNCDDGGVYRAPLSGGAAVRLNPALPPGGVFQGWVMAASASRIVYLADQDTLGVDELYSVAIAGGASTKLSGSLAPDGDVVTWQTQGATVTYMADQDTDDVVELYAVPVTGGGSVKLNGPLTVGGQIAYWFTTPQRVVYVAEQDTAGVTEVYSVSIQGGTPVKLSGPMTPGGSVSSLDVSPDGSTAVYVADQDTAGTAEVYTVPVTGGRPAKLNAAMVSGGQVGWTVFVSGGSRVVFYADQDTDDVFEIYSVGMATGADADGDGILNACDLCPTVADPGQADTDGNGVGDACQACATGTDPDHDDVCSAADNCPAVPNASQVDFDADGAGDACDADDDNDGLSDAAEANLGTDPLDADTDDDGVTDGDEVAGGTDPSSGTSTSPGVPFHAGRAIAADLQETVSVFAADIDGDGDMDAISAPYFTGKDRVDWYENNGARPPLFTAHTISTVALDVLSVYAADVDGDGDIDVLSASETDNKIAWYENNGGSPPAWTARTISTAASGAASVFAADVDGDGDTDVLSASHDDNKIAWYENNGGSPPAWTARTISTAASAARSVAAADVDGDGDTDVLSASVGDNKIAWYENNRGSPPAWTARTISTTAVQAISVASADVDGDGDTDVLSASRGDDKIAWYENNGGSPPAWTAHTISTAADLASSVAAADVDGDGDTDVLSASFFDNKIAWYENDGASTPAWTTRIISSSASFAFKVFAADADRDGDLDVLSAGDGTVAWYENLTPHRNAAFGSPATIGNGANPYHAIPADINGDGRVDVVASSANDDRVRWLESDGAHPPGFTSHTITTTADGVEFIAAVDLNRDDDIDVLSASFNDDKIAWYESSGGAIPTWTEHVVTLTADGVWWVAAADLDADGDVDLLSASLLDTTVAWYENDGASPPGWTKRVISSSTQTRRCAVADLDGDGDLDVVAPRIGPGTMAWFRNDGGAPLAWTTLTLFGTTGIGTPNAVTTADLDNDGDIDVAASASADTLIAWYENNGAPSPAWSLHIIPRAVVGWFPISAGDLDGDGDVDLLSGGPSNLVVWSENDGGHPPSFADHTLAITGVANSVEPADVDGDGHTDILAGVRVTGGPADTFLLFPNVGGQFSLAATSLAPASIASGGSAVAFQMDLTSNGRPPDSAVELARLALGVTDGGGVSLSSAEANALIERVRVYADSGSGSFEPDSDALVATVDTLELSPLSIELTHGDPRVRVAPGTTKRLFALVETKPTASAQNPNAFRLVQLPALTAARDASSLGPLTRQPAASVSTGTITATGDAGAPTVTAIFPPTNASGVALATSVVVYFSEDIDPATAAPGIVLYAGVVKVACHVRAGGRTATIDPDASLALGGSYTVRVSSLVRDRSGNPAVTFTSTFNTVTDPGAAIVGPSEVGVTVGGTILGGANADENSGVAVAAVGDVNAAAASFGISDLIIGAPNADGGATDAGKATLVFGSAGLSSNTAGFASLVYRTGVAQDYVGETVARAGDLNGDSIQDFLIGAPRSDQAFANAGVVYLVFGNSGLDELAPATLDLNLLASCATPTLCGVKFRGGAAQDLAGSSLSTAGDVNGDGHDDILIGAPGASPGGRSGAGRVYLIYGPLAPGTINLANVGSSVPGLVLNGELAGDHFGAAVSSWPDRNGDGFDDLLIGAPGATALDLLGVPRSAAGYVYAIQGSAAPGHLDDSGSPGVIEMSRVANGENDQVAGMVFLGPAADANIGRSLTGAVDLDGNGVKDVLIAGNGVAFCIPGDGPKIRLGGTQTGDTSGGGGLRAAVLQAARDFGALTFVSGNDDPLTIGPAGDINNDGFDDFIIGSPFADTAGGIDAGRAYVIFGSPEPGEGTHDLADVGSEVPGLVVDGAEAGDNLGATVGGGFDLNGDGVDDGLVGAPFADAGSSTAQNAGETYVIAVGFTCATSGAPVGTLRISKPSLPGSEPDYNATITWGGSLVVQLIRGDLTSLRGTGGVTNVDAAGCLANNVLLASVNDNSIVGSGASYYLMKTPRSCTVYSTDTFSELLPDELPGAGGTRDSDIAGSANACP